MSTIYDVTVPVFLKYLRNLERWIDKAVAYAEEKKFDPEILMQARLAPDMHPFLRQVTIACDNAKWAAAKLAGQEGPAHPDTETTIADLRARLATVTGYLETFEPADFEGAKERRCAHTWMGGKGMSGADYLQEFALANFFFHVVTAYAILRHNGVPLGKMDYIGGLTMA
jgi:hypothetical protein